MSDNEKNLEELESTTKIEKVVEKTASDAKDEIKEGMKGIKNVFDKVGAKTKEIKEKEEKENNSIKKKEAYVTCRILFISILDKLMLIALCLEFVIATYGNFRGDMSSLTYGFWSRVAGEIGILIGLAITYFFMNWLYKCAAKTMLCVADGEIYYEKYIPFVRWEGTIPLNKVTAVQSYKFLWIFRAVVIFQYMHLPKIFWTWNAQQFKDKVEELVTKNDYKVKNQFESRNIINKNQYKYLAIVGGLLVAIIVFLGVVRFFSYMFSDERNLQGNYVNGRESIILNKDGTCSIRLDNINSVKCDWKYNSDLKEVSFQYTYESKFYGSTSQYEGYMYASYAKKTLNYNGTEFKK